MTDKGAFADRKRTQEEEYFRKQEQQQIEKMRRHAALEAERRELAEALGVSDEEALGKLQELGFTREMAPLVYLAPPVQDAWADGRVSASERELILADARSRGIAEDSLGGKALAGWLDHRPAESFFEKTLSAIGAMLRALPPDQRESQKRDLVSACARIAEASGGIIDFLGFGSKVSKAEQETIARITAELERGDSPATEETIGG